MPIAPRALVVTSVLGLAGPALAQTEADLNLSLAGGRFVQTDEARYVNIDDCDSQIDATLNLSGEYVAESFGEYDLRLTFTDRAGVCERDAFGESCSVTSYEVDDEVCVCIAEVANTASISRTGLTLREVLPDVCDSAAGAPREFSGRFYLQYYGASSGGDETAVEANSAPLVVEFDFQRPDAPAAAPTEVLSVEGGLLVRFASVGGEVGEYEICALAEGVTPDLTGVTGNLALRAGYGNCTTAQADTQARLSGLSNGVSYAVVYAAVDPAGNRSANSPVANGTPQAAYDFAEWYRSRNGPASGGCSATPGGGGAPLGLLFACGALICVARRKDR